MGKPVFNYIIWGVALISLVILLVALGQATEIELPNTEEKAQATPPRDIVVKERNASGSVIPVKVTVHKSYAGINEAYRRHYSIDIADAIGVVGWYDIDRGVCEIHVLDIIYVKGDPNMMTWGHELTHCVYGKFHK